MASLINWGGLVNRVGNTLNNDVVKPFQRDVVAPVANVARAAAPAVRVAQQVAGAGLNPVHFAASRLNTTLPGIGVTPAQIGAQLPSALVQAPVSVAKFGYNNVVKPIIQNVGNVATDLNQAQHEIGWNQIAANQQLKQLDQIDAQNQAAFKTGRINLSRLKQLNQDTIKSRSQITGALNQQVSKYRTPGQSVGDLGQFGTNLISTGSSGAGTESKTLVQAVLRGAAPNAAYGAISGGLTGLSNKESLPNIIKDTLMGGGQGVLLGGVLGAGGYGFNKLSNAAAQDIKGGAPSLNNERGGMQPRDINGQYGNKSVPVGQLQAEAASQHAQDLLKSIKNDEAAGLTANPSKIKAYNDALTLAQQKRISPLGIINNERGGVQLGQPKPLPEPPPVEQNLADSLTNSSIQAGNEQALTNSIANNPREYIPVKERQQIINDNANQQTVNKVSINPEVGNTRGAIAQAQGIANEFNSRLDRADTLASKLDKHDQNLLSERADPNVKIEPHNPAAFQKAVAAHSDAFDYSLAAQRAAGGSTLRFGGGDYHPLYLAADSAKMDALGIPAADRIQAGKFTGFRDITRQYRSYADAAKSGLNPLNSSRAQDLEMYAKQGQLPIRNAALRAALEKSNPGEVADVGSGITAEGKPFQQAAGANLPFNVSENVDKYLKNYTKPYEPNSTAGKLALKGVEKTNAGAKQALFFGTPFHAVSETSSFLGSNIFHPIVAAKGVGRAFQSVSGEGWQNVLDKARSTDVNGANVLDSARSMGVELRDNSALNRLTSAYSLTQAEAALKSGIDPTSIEGIKAGGLINKIAGQKNAAVLGSDPTIDRLTRAGSLAPQWTPAQLRLLKDAFTKPGIGRFTEGGGARNLVLGKRALLGGAAIVGSAAIAGRLPTLEEAKNQAGLNLNNPVPNIALNSTNSKGESQVMDLPTDPLGLGLGLLNPSTRSHFLQSRYSPALSFATKVATNQNWNGQPLADPAQPNFALNLVKNAAINSVTPIGVQNFTNLQNNPNNPSIAQGIAQEFGGRLKTNPNDPGVVATKDYFNARDSFTKTLNPNEQTLFNKLNPVSKDAYGNPINSKTPLTKASDYADLVANPDFLSKYQAYQQSQTSHDPLWDLTTPQLKSYMQATILTKNDPGGDPTTTSALYKSLPSNFFDNRTAYFNDLKTQGVNLPADTTSSTKPTMPANLVAFSDSYHNLPSGTGARSAALKTPTGQAYIAYLDQNRAYNNQQRADLGLPALANPATKYGSSGGSKKIGTTIKGAKLGSIKAPKISGIKIAKAKAYKPVKTRKLSVSRMPSSATKRKLA